MIDNEVLSVVEGLVQQHKEQVKQLSGIIEQCGVVDADQNLAVNSDSPLARMLTN
jgi:hypothetical protein